MIKSLHSVILEKVLSMKNHSLIKILSSPCDRYSGLEYLVMLGGHTVAYKYSNQTTIIRLETIVVYIYIYDRINI